MGDHRRRPADHESPLGRYHCTAIADDEKLRGVGFQMALGGIQDPVVEAAGQALLGAEGEDDMPLGTPTFARLRLGFRSESERFTDRAADDRGIGADAGEPSACLTGPGGGAAAHRRDHRLQLMDGADPAFDFTELAAHATFAFCSSPPASSLARSQTAEARTERAASSRDPVFVIAATVSPACASRSAATRSRSSSMTCTGKESKTPSARPTRRATWSARRRAAKRG